MNVRDISGFRRYKRYPVIKTYEMPEKKRTAFGKAKYLAVLAVAFFLLVTTVNEGVRTWLKYSGKRDEASGSLVVPESLTVTNRQPSLVQAKAADELGFLREQNRYRVDMTREQNRFVTDLFGTAERLTGRFNR